MRRANSLKRPWCWERLKEGGEGDNRGLDGWMASPTQRTWVWASFGSWWWTGKPGMLQSMGSQWVGHNQETELNWTKPMVQRLKHLPTMRETGVWSLHQEDPLEKDMATHSSMLLWRIPWTEEPGGLQSMGSQRVGHDWATEQQLSTQMNGVRLREAWHWDELLPA